LSFAFFFSFFFPFSLFHCGHFVDICSLLP
jgi:hypothetical protein